MALGAASFLADTSCKNDRYKGNTDTIAEYLELLSKAGLLIGLQKYNGNKLIDHRRSSPRLMVFDTSLAIASAAFSQNDADAFLNTPDLRGYLVESAIGAHLLANSEASGYEVLWWRDGNFEVDFVLRRGDSITAIEVKSGRNKRSEGIYEFKKRHPQVTTIVVGDRNCTYQDFLEDKVELFSKCDKLLHNSKE